MLKRNLLIISVVSVALVLLFNTYYDIYSISSSSMYPTIRTGDYLLIKKNRISRHRRKSQNRTEIIRDRIYVFDIPFMESNKNYFNGEANNKYVKRCVGYPNDTLHFIENSLYVNSVLLKRYSINPLKNIETRNLLGIISPEYRNCLTTIYYPHDSLYSWNIYNVGPLYIPKKNKKIQLTDSLRVLY